MLPSYLTLLEIHNSLNKNAAEAIDYWDYDHMDYMIKNFPNVYMAIFKLLWDSELLSDFDRANRLVGIPKKLTGKPRGIGIGAYCLKNAYSSSISSIPYQNQQIITLMYDIYDNVVYRHNCSSNNSNINILIVS